MRATASSARSSVSPVSLTLSILLGAVLGLLGTAPYAFVLARVVREGPGGPGVPQGLVCVIASTAFVGIGIAVCYRADPAAIVPFASSAALTFLAASTATVLLARKKINR